jgi:hypothetical protein
MGSQKKATVRAGGHQFGRKPPSMASPALAMSAILHRHDNISAAIRETTPNLTYKKIKKKKQEKMLLVKTFGPFE